MILQELGRKSSAGKPTEASSHSTHGCSQLKRHTEVATTGDGDHDANADAAEDAKNGGRGSTGSAHGSVHGSAHSSAVVDNSEELSLLELWLLSSDDDDSDDSGDGVDSGDGDDDSDDGKGDGGDSQRSSFIGAPPVNNATASVNSHATHSSKHHNGSSAGGSVDQYQYEEFSGNPFASDSDEEEEVR
jgi:hypothetical protein